MVTIGAPGMFSRKAAASVAGPTRASSLGVIVVLLCAVIALVSARELTPAWADPSDDKARVDQELAQAQSVFEFATGRAQQAAAQHMEAVRALPAAQEEVAQAHGEVIAAQVEAREAQRVVNAATKALDEAQAAYDRADEAVQAERVRLNDFARDSYEGGHHMTATAVLAVEGPDDLVAALGYVQAVAAQRREAVQDMNQARLVAAEERATVTARKQEADDANNRAQEAFGNAERQEQEAVSAQQRVTELVGQREQALTVAEQERAASDAQYQELQAESARLADALRGEQAQGLSPQQTDNADAAPPPQRASGRLAQPVDGYLSSDFGMRYDPFYGVWQLHAGADFAAPGGAPIYAAAMGRVARTGWNGGYGNYTCLYHGEVDAGGLSTCYAHQSEILVSTGDWVSQGQLIGRVGTTGASTGYHLHFEVRINGDPVNPMEGWL